MKGAAAQLLCVVALLLPPPPAASLAESQEALDLARRQLDELRDRAPLSPQARSGGGAGGDSPAGGAGGGMMERVTPEMYGEGCCASRVVDLSLTHTVVAKTGKSVCKDWSVRMPSSRRLPRALLAQTSYRST